MTSENWHLDKRIPITLIFAIVLQTFSFGWMAKSIDGKTESNRQAIAVINRELDLRRSVIESNAVAVAVLRAQLDDIKESQRESLEILQKLEKAGDK